MCQAFAPDALASLPLLVPPENEVMVAEPLVLFQETSWFQLHRKSVKTHLQSHGFDLHARVSAGMFGYALL